MSTEQLITVLEAVRRQGSARGQLRGLLHILIGRRIAAEDGTVISPGLTWRETAVLLKRLRWDTEAVRVGKKSFASNAHLPALIYPNPLNPTRYVVLNSGFTFAHPRSSSNADQTPKLPDYAVVDIRGSPSVGVAGEIVEAGFFDEQWKLADARKPE